MKTMIRTILIVLSLFLVDTAIEGIFNYSFIAAEAEAVIGRPATPGSVAGVARRTSRRTTRRVIRRTSVYVAALPVTGCTTVVIEGTTLHQCGATYYQPYNNQYVVVNVE
jgi:hypothetical protein